MNKQLFTEIFISGLTRHGSQALGGALVATGIGTESDATVIVGAALNAGAFLWSAWRKRRRAKKAARNEIRSK